MAESLPSIDFGFNDLRERMAQFTLRFDEFIERGRKKVLEERNAFRMNVAELEGTSGIAIQHRSETDAAYRCPKNPEDSYHGARVHVLHARPNPGEGSG